MSPSFVAPSIHTSASDEPITFVVPKGRLGKDFDPWFQDLGITPEEAFYDEHSRKLFFETNDKNFRLIRVRSFDVITYLALGGASLGVVGSDILAEFGHASVFAPVDLGIGRCRLVSARLQQPPGTDQQCSISALRVASKYPNITRAHFQKKGLQCEVVKLNGAIELAPKLGICPMIVDLLSTGRTLRENGLVEVETLLHVSARLVVNRVRYKTATTSHHRWIEKFREIADDRNC